MGRFIGIVLLITLGVVAYGDHRGWFTTTSAHGPGGSNFGLHFDREKFQRDRQTFIRDLEVRLELLELRLEKLQAQAKNETGETKAEMDAQLVEQRANVESAKKKVAEARETSADKWADVKSRTSAALDDLHDGFEKAFARFR